MRAESKALRKMKLNANERTDKLKSFSISWPPSYRSARLWLRKFKYAELIQCLLGQSFQLFLDPTGATSSHGTGCVAASPPGYDEKPKI